MSKPYDAEHELLKEKSERNEKRINNHSERLDKLEVSMGKSLTQIDYLCKQIGDLVSTLKWGMTFTIGVLVSFLIWYIQNIGK